MTKIDWRERVTANFTMPVWLWALIFIFLIFGALANLLNTLGVT